MEIKQIATMVNSITNEVIGESALVSEDLSNIVDVGTAVANANAYDTFTQKLVNRIGKTIFSARKYVGRVPSLVRDKWEFGSMLQKITGAGLIEAQQNDTWNLTDGTSYDPNKFTKPSLNAKFYNKKVTFELPQSIAIKQVKQSMSSAAELNGLLDMLYNEIEKSLTVKVDSLCMRCINNLINNTILNGGGNAVNLLTMYNAKFTKTLTAEAAITDPDFIRFAAYIMRLYATRMRVISTHFNTEGLPRFTPADSLHVLMLEDFASAADIYLYSNTFHDDFVKLPTAETVPYWQGTGESYAFADISKILAKPTGGGPDTGEGVTGILGIIYDKDAAGVCLEDSYVTSQVNNKAEFVNNWHKYEAEYINDYSEQNCVFYVA